MSGLGDALTNIGRDWSARQYDEQRQAVDERKFLLRERIRQQNALELKRFQQLLDQEDAERKYNHPDAVKERKRAQEKADADLARIESQTALNKSRAEGSGKVPEERGGTLWVWDPKTKTYKDTRRAVPKSPPRSRSTSPAPTQQSLLDYSY